ncbi:hypothetical protein AWU65_00085 [Paenibacillus glucanolyticus]|uniref:Major facilitator superfamily (MFS) profile domain-containing protein n=1 Tax=Paenibacillus glucanolyticus TaxID=59843 RepID=A0A163D8I8_9BACL|nr:hypothetical protein [Paenibacillus glucanolyticus]KZS43065.1 hypothetical protein AWU65_00085 [Paenibacillus glucanolyticus]
MSTTIKEIRAPLFAIIIGMFMVLLNMTAMNVAIPKLMNTFQSPLSIMQWATTGYILAEAAIIPVAGWLTALAAGACSFWQSPSLQSALFFAHSQLTLSNLYCFAYFKV